MYEKKSLHEQFNVVAELQKKTSKILDKVLR